MKKNDNFLQVLGLTQARKTYKEEASTYIHTSNVELLNNIFPCEQEVQLNISPLHHSNIRLKMQTQNHSLPNIESFTAKNQNIYFMQTLTGKIK